VTEDWKAAVAASESKKSFFAKHLSHVKPEELGIEASLVNEAGEVQSLGNVVQGGAVHGILGKTLMSKAVRLLKRDPTSRIPLTVHQPPDPRHCSALFSALPGIPGP
jgi:hypothetical protein